MAVEPRLSSLFLKYLLKGNIRYQDDLVDQLFNSSEKRLARVLLLMAQYGDEDGSMLIQGANIPIDPFKKRAEAPREPGEPFDRERAKRPPLPILERRRN